jgi:hypothetical protein
MALVYPTSGPIMKFMPDTTPRYVRPADWPGIPAAAANTVAILAAVWNNGSNYAAVNATVSSGTYTVDWGDGSAPEAVTSATTASHQYTYSDGDLGALTAEGYKTAIVTITPTTGGQNITGLNLNVRHSSIGHEVSNPWIDLQITAAELTALSVSGSTGRARYLQRAVITAIGAIMSLANCYENCSSLQSIVYPAGSLASVLYMSYCHSGNSSLQSIVYPAGSLASVQDMSYCHYGNSSLQSIVYPAGSLASVPYMSYCHYGNSSLQSIVYPAGSLASVLYMNYCHSGNSSLQSIVYPAGSLASVQDMSSCHYGNSSLASITGMACPITFDISYCNLSAAALDAIYTALPSVSGQTITVTGNVGTGGDDPSIATAKGWTVTGS